MSSSVLRVGFVGAGAIHFGGAEGPWDHATRLEKIPNIQVLGIADPLVDKAQKVLESRKSGPGAKQYESCKVFKSAEDMIEQLKLDAVFIGTPPLYRGSLEKGKQLELMCVQAGIHAFIEKPMSVIAPLEFNKYVSEVVKAQREKNVIVSVGYMFRYHAAVRQMKEIISQHGGKVMAFNARYFLAYSQLDHAFWWNAAKSGGPIVEQATHFCDLARYLVGDIDLPTVQTTCLPATDPSGAGTLSNISPGMEDGVSEENLAPRVTASHWRFKSGAVGSLMHAVALHGKRYESHIDVLMDGLRMTLYEPYHPECKLLVRDAKTGSDYETVFPHGGDDPYKTEIECFIEAARTKNTERVACSYSDAAKTYEFSWKIRSTSKS